MMRVNSIGRDAVPAQRSRARDQRAIDRLVRCYDQRIYVHIKRIVGDHFVAEDLYQETFKITLERILRDEVRVPERLLGFIYQVARNITIDYCRREKRRRNTTVVEQGREYADPAPSQLDRLTRRETAKIVRQIIGELKLEQDRQLLFRF